jgi:hypothetical protein
MELAARGVGQAQRGYRWAGGGTRTTVRSDSGPKNDRFGSKERRLRDAQLAFPAETDDVMTDIRVLGSVSFGTFFGPGSPRRFHLWGLGAGDNRWLEHHRSAGKWLWPSCCDWPGLAPILLSSSKYLLTTFGDGVRVHQYCTATPDVSAGSGAIGSHCFDHSPAANSPFSTRLIIKPRGRSYFAIVDESLTSTRRRTPKSFRRRPLATGDVNMVTKIVTALVATVMLATAIGTTPSFAQNRGQVQHYDGSGAPTGPY